jgi:hypothetical protein
VPLLRKLESYLKNALSQISGKSTLAKAIRYALSRWTAYAARLVRDRLARQGIWRCLSLVGNLLSWIARSRSNLSDLDERLVERYLRHRAGKQTIQPGWNR